MSSYRKRTQSKPTTAAGLRAQASANGRSIFGNRPRSIAGLFSTHNQNTYSNLLGITPNTYTPPSFINKFTNKSKSWNTSNNNYSSPYASSYGGTCSGYGGIVLPSSHSTISSLNLAVPSTSSSYSTYTPPNNATSKQSALRRASSLSKSKAKFNSSNFSRSSSLQSLTSSEGYIVREDNGLFEFYQFFFFNLF